MREPEAISLEPCRDGRGSCNCCFASNYDSMLAPIYGKVDRLYDVHIGGMVVRLCDSCMDQLRAALEKRP